MKKVFWIIAVTLTFTFVSLLNHEPVSGQTPPPKTPDVLTRGKAIYAKKCSSCHGSEGNGQTPMAKILKPPPRDFTEPLKDWAASHGDPIKVFRAIKDGIPNSAMVKVDLPDEDIWALAYAVMEFSRASQ